MTLEISIHASRGGSDLRPLCQAGRHSHFNPRFPRGKRLILPFFTALATIFQSTLPAGEATVFHT